LGRNSSCRGHFLTLPVADVLLGHYHGRMPKLISGLHDVAAGFGLVRAGFGAQVAPSRTTIHLDRLSDAVSLEVNDLPGLSARDKAVVLERINIFRARP
jgi:hypothetical protein